MTPKHRFHHDGENGLKDLNASCNRNLRMNAHYVWLPSYHTRERIFIHLYRFINYETWWYSVICAGRTGFLWKRLILQEEFAALIADYNLCLSIRWEPELFISNPNIGQWIEASMWRCASSELEIRLDEPKLSAPGSIMEQSYWSIELVFGGQTLPGAVWIACSWLFLNRTQF